MYQQRVGQTQVILGELVGRRGPTPPRRRSNDEDRAAQPRVDGTAWTDSQGVPSDSCSRRLGQCAIMPPVVWPSYSFLWWRVSAAQAAGSRSGRHAAPQLCPASSTGSPATWVYPN